MTHGLDRLLVGIDAAGRSLEALAAAGDLSRRFDAAVEVVHAIEVESPLAVPGPGDPREAAARIQAATEAWARTQVDGHLRAGWPRPHSGDNLVVRVAHAGHLLVERAAASAAQVLFLGPHARRGRIDFGGAMRAVMAHAPCDLWVQPCPWEPPRRVLVPIDLSRGSLRALERGRVLAREFDAELVVLHAWTPPTFSLSAEAVDQGASTDLDVILAAHQVDREAFQRALSDVDWDGVRHRSRWVEGRPAQAILAEDPDLVALGTHGRTGLRAALFGSVAYEVMRSARTPVLAVRWPSD